jgi:hypothetical protein
VTKKINSYRVVRKLTAFVGGAVLLQTGGCAVDEALVTQLITLSAQVLLGVISGTPTF